MGTRAGPTPDSPDTILQGGRRKAYRPLPPDAIASAVADGLAAYRAGAYFEAHELLEPAWMGSREMPERELYQALIKLAAAHVHAERGNALGWQKNLAGALSRLRAARAGGVDERIVGIRLDDLERAMTNRLGDSERPRPITLPELRGPS